MHTLHYRATFIYSRPSQTSTTQSCLSMFIKVKMFNFFKQYTASPIPSIFLAWHHPLTQTRSAPLTHSKPLPPRPLQPRQSRQSHHPALTTHNNNNPSHNPSPLIVNPRPRNQTHQPVQGDRQVCVRDRDRDHNRAHPSRAGEGDGRGESVLVGWSSGAHGARVRISNLDSFFMRADWWLIRVWVGR